MIHKHHTTHQVQNTLFSSMLITFFRDHILGHKAVSTKFKGLKSQSKFSSANTITPEISNEKIIENLHIFQK